ncbi:MAG: neutral zinc metallopeptidase [Verrucomicrobiae bacterium]|nr:neutral zinc metallopeptidase [Verrucomicrobiae bacterium]NNJ87438.1 flagellar biosynthesis protein FlgM [Akkermansiaceae bacterium]
MRWKGRRQSTNVEDRRGTTVRGGGGPAMGGALGGLVFSLFRRGSGKTKLILIAGVIIACFVFKMNPLSLLGLSGGGGGGTQLVQNPNAKPDQQTYDYLSTLKADNEDVWSKILPRYGLKYRPSKMVIYSDKTTMTGGIADARMGPFYAPSEEKIYIDPGFFQELKRKFGAKGDFAEAYVLAHEVGHHIQKIMKRTDYVHSQRRKLSDADYNKLSVRLELHADFLAGVFAHHGQEQFKFLERGDIQEALDCAEAIGDDRLQERAHGHVQPESFTHGTSEQRRKWFMHGYKTGDLRQGEQIYTMPYEDL